METKKIPCHCRTASMWQKCEENCYTPGSDPEPNAVGSLEEVVEKLVDRLYQNISGEKGVRIDLISSHNRPIECIRKPEMKKIIQKELEIFFES